MDDGDKSADLTAGGDTADKADGDTDPMLAAVLSFFVPGLGHLYAGQVGLGVWRFFHYFIGCWGTILVMGFVVFPIVTAVTGGLGGALYLLLPIYLLMFHLGLAAEAHEKALDDEEADTEADVDEPVEDTPSWPPERVEDLEALSYRELQQHAKEHDIRANRSGDEIIARLCREYDIEEGYADRPASEADLESYSYRDLQLLAKEHGVKANQTTEDLRTVLVDTLGLPAESHHNGNNNDTDG